MPLLELKIYRSRFRPKRNGARRGWRQHHARKGEVLGIVGESGSAERQHVGPDGTRALYFRERREFIKQMAPVVKAAKAALEGKTVDGKALSDLVRDRLSKLG